METPRRENRVFPRKRVSCEGELVDAVSGSAARVALLDVSIGGLSFLSSQPCKKGSLWLIRFTLDGESARGVVSIAYCVKHSLADSFRVGAEFRNWETAYLRRIEDYLG